MKLILASQSPRRKELLERLGYDFEVQKVEIDEQLDTDLLLPFALEKLALRKAQALNIEDALVLGADTIVLLDEEVLNKPRDLEEAKAMLRRLSDRSHEVISAVALLYKNEYVSFHDVTKVTFEALSEEWIEHYVTHYEVLDKAGAYGIQDESSTNHFVKATEGDVTNVVGLPVEKLASVLNDMEVNKKND